MDGEEKLRHLLIVQLVHVKIVEPRHHFFLIRSRNSFKNSCLLLSNVPLLASFVCPIMSKRQQCYYWSWLFEISLYWNRIDLPDYNTPNAVKLVLVTTPSTVSFMNTGF